MIRILNKNKNKKLSLTFKVLLGGLIGANILFYFRPFYENKYLYFAKFIFVGLIFVFLVSYFLISRRKIKISKDTRVITMFFTIWLFSMIAGFFRADWIFSGTLLILSYILLFLLSFFLFPNYIKTYSKYFEYKKVFFWIVLFLILISVIIGIYDSESIYSAGSRIRYRAFFNDPNLLGIFSFLGILTSVSVYFLKFNKKYLFPIPFYLILIYFSGSRASLFSIIIFGMALLTYFLCSKLRIKEEKMLIRIGLSFLYSIIFAGLAFYFYTSLVSFAEVSSHVNRLLSLRPFFWFHAIQGLEGYDWILGKGLGKEGFGAISYENFYLNTFVQNGIIGLSAFLLFIFSILYCLFKKRNERFYGSLAVVSVMFFTICIYSFFESLLFSLGHIVILYLWMDLGFFITHNKRQLLNA